MTKGVGSVSERASTSNSKQEDKDVVESADREAKFGERMIELKVCFWTDGIAGRKRIYQAKARLDEGRGKDYQE